MQDNLIKKMGYKLTVELFERFDKDYVMDCKRLEERITSVLGKERAERFGLDEFFDVDRISQEDKDHIEMMRHLIRRFYVSSNNYSAFDSRWVDMISEMALANTQDRIWQ